MKRRTPLETIYADLMKKARAVLDPTHHEDPPGAKDAFQETATPRVVLDLIEGLEHWRGMAEMEAITVSDAAKEIERLRKRTCKLCVEYDHDEHDPSCCPHKYGCCGKACPNCDNRGTPYG